jgi:uncharacterized protein (TIGR03435 family)
MSSRRWIALGLVMVAGALTAAQTPAGPAFEVASVKPNTSGDGRVMMAFQPGGRFTATGVTLQMLMRNAYRLQDYQLIGAPDWMRSERFDVSAKGDGAVGPDQIQPMMRALLADRFKLVTHAETRELPIYALVPARSDGRLGPNLKPSTVDCEALGAARGRGGNVPVPPPGGAGTSTVPLRGAQPGMALGRGAGGGPPPCSTRLGPGSVTGSGIRLPQLATMLAGVAGRLVQDKSGLSGAFDIELSWTPDTGGARPLDGAPGPPAADTGGTSLFTAVQEQLGLKLESMRAPVDVTVIDRVERPLPD